MTTKSASQYSNRLSNVADSRSERSHGTSSLIPNFKSSDACQWRMVESVEPTEIVDNWEHRLRAAMTKLSSSLDESMKQSRLTILENRVTQLEDSSSTIIASFAPERVKLLKAIPVSIRYTGDDFVATFFDATLSASGDTHEEAFENLKDIILSIFQMFSEMHSDTLGPLPRRQLAVLSDFLQLDD